jgi:type II secretory pathway component PulF
MHHSIPLTMNDVVSFHRQLEALLCAGISVDCTRGSQVTLPQHLESIAQQIALKNAEGTSVAIAVRDCSLANANYRAALACWSRPIERSRVLELVTQTNQVSATRRILGQTSELKLTLIACLAIFILTLWIVRAGPRLLSMYSDWRITHSLQRDMLQFLVDWIWFWPVALLIIVGWLYVRSVRRWQTKKAVPNQIAETALAYKVVGLLMESGVDATQAIESVTFFLGCSLPSDVFNQPITSTNPRQFEFSAWAMNKANRWKSMRSWSMSRTTRGILLGGFVVIGLALVEFLPLVELLYRLGEKR